MNLEMKTYRQTEKNRSCLYLVCIMVLLLLGILCIIKVNQVLQLSGEKWIRFVLFFPFGLLFPGYLLARNITEYDNSSQLYAFSIIFGIGICIAEYFLDYYILNIGIQGCFFSKFGGPILSAPALFLLLSDIRRKRIKSYSLIPEPSVLVLILVAEMIAFASTALASGLPGYTKSYVDVVWNIGNIASLNHGWPAGNFQYLGKALNSNILGLIFRAVLSRFIGATAAETMQVFSSFVFIPLLIFALDCFGLWMTGGNTKKAVIFVAVFVFTGFLGRAFLFFYNIDWAYAVTNSSYLVNDIHWLFYAPYGIDVAIPGTAILFVLIKMDLDNSKVSFWLITAIGLVAFLVTGGKYVFTICILGALIGTAILQMLQGKHFKIICRDLLRPFVMTVIGFSLAFFGIVRGGEVFLPATNSSATFMTSSDKRYAKARYEFIDQLAAEEYQYLIVESAGTDGMPIVRQKSTGEYCVYGSGLKYCEVEQEALLDDLGHSAIQTIGILNGGGGYFDYEDSRDSGILVINALGFFRYTEEGQENSVLCFYSRAPEVRELHLDLPTNKEVIRKLFNIKSEWGVIGGPFEKENDWVIIRKLFNAGNGWDVVRYQFETGCDWASNGVSYEKESNWLTICELFAQDSDWPMIGELFVPGSDGTEIDYSDQYSSFSINEAMRRTRLYNFLTADTMISQSSISKWFMLLLIPVYLIACRPVTFIPFLFWIKEKLSQFREISTSDSIICGSAICGLIGFFFLSVQGLSQSYFLDVAVIVIDLIGINWTYDHFISISKTAKMLLICAVIIGFCSQGSYYLYTAREGYRRVKESYIGSPMDYEPGPGYISAAEREAMDWLRVNSPIDAVLATNRHYNETQVQRWKQPRPNDYASRFYYYPAYSERQMFIGSWSYMPRTAEMQEMLRERLVVNDALFDPFCANKKEIMEKNGIDYLVASAEAGSGMNMKDEDLVCVFRNPIVAIYVLKDAEVA